MATKVKEEMRFDERITIHSLADWVVGFNKKDSVGDVLLDPHGSVRITRSEFIAQFEAGNALICGTGDGKHATVYTDDVPVKEYLGITSEPLSEVSICKLFDSTNFEDDVCDAVATRTEAMLLFGVMRKKKFNDYNKIRFCEEKFGMKL